MLFRSDLRQWRITFDFLDKHIAGSKGDQDRMIGRVGETFELNRRQLLDSVGRASRMVMDSYDREAEAGKLAASVRDSIAGTALVEVGAVGLGVLLVAILNTALLDFTGIMAAGSLAVIGLLILPARRRRAKVQLAERLEDLRRQLIKSMSDAFEKEQERSLQRLRESVAPYTRFIRSERQRLSRVDHEIDEIVSQLARIRMRIEAL